MEIIKASEVACYSMPFKYFIGEIIELLHEVKRCNLCGIRSEFWDVYTCFHEWLYHSYHLNLPLFNNPSARAWNRRWFWWKVWLGAHCLEFYPHYMKFGSNFARREKRHRVLSIAKEEQCRP